MPNMTNSLIASVTATEDTSGNVPINRSTGNPALDSTVAQLVEYATLAAGANIIGLPISPCCQVYIRNIDPAKTITVNWTPNGGAANNVVLLNPNDQLILWQKPGTTTPGITSLTLTPSAVGALVEYFLGG